MSKDEGILEQVLLEAKSRAEEIRNEIATLKEKTGASSTVTVPQLLKGDAVPDVTEPEGKPDDPESSLQYNVSTPSGERQAPPKTEDGTDTEDQPDNPLTLYARACRAAAEAGQNQTAGDAGWDDTAQVTGHMHDSCDTEADAAALGSAHAEPQSSWQGVYKDVLQKLNQSRSFRQHFSSDSELASMLQEAGLAGIPDSSAPKVWQMATPFAGDTCQAAAVAAGAITTGGFEHTEPAVQGVANTIEPSPVHVVEGPHPISSATAADNTQKQWQPQPMGAAGYSESKNTSSGGSSDTMPINVAASSTSSSENGSLRGQPGRSRLPLVMPASAADLPVHAVLQELDELLAWQTSRSPAGAAQQQAKARVTVPAARTSAEQLIADQSGTAGPQSRPTNDDDSFGEEDMVSKWLRATQQERHTLSRSNSASCALTEDAPSRSGSSCSLKRTMRRSNSVPPAANHGLGPSDDEGNEKVSKLGHSPKQESADLRDEIISHLKLAAAFRPQSRNGSQDAEAATANRVGAPIASITASSHQQNPPPGSVDWAGIDRYLDGASTPTGTDSPDLHSRHSQSTPTQQQLQLDAAADRQTPAQVHSISVSRSANLATVSSPGAGLESPQTAESPKLPSKTAQLYQKLLQGSLAGASSSSSPKAASPSRQHRTSQSNGDSVAGSPIARSSTLGKSMPLAAGSPAHRACSMSHSPGQQLRPSTDGQCRPTCSACGSPVATKSSPFAAGAGDMGDTELAAGTKSPHAAFGPAASRFAADPAAPQQAPATPDSSSGSGVAFASLSLSALLGDDMHNHTSSISKAGPGGVYGSASSPVRASANSHSSYSSRAASRRALASSMGSGTLRNALSKAASVAAVVASPPRKLAAASRASPQRAGYALSAGKQVSRVRAAAVAGGGSTAGVAGSGSSDAGVEGGAAAMATAISCGQLLQEAALQQAFRRVSGGPTSDGNGTPQQDTAHGQQAAALQQMHVNLDMPSDAAQLPAGQSSVRSQQEHQGRGATRRSSTGDGDKASGVFVYRLQPTNDASSTSPAAAAAAAAALQTLAAGASRKGVSVSPGRSPSPKRDAVSPKHDRSNSAGPPSRSPASPGYSRTSSSKSKTSVTSCASGGSQRIWRPGGQRTSAKDDCRKLQAYESARRALIAGSTPSPSKAPAASASSSRSKSPGPAAVKRPASPQRSATAKSGKTPRTQAASPETPREPKVGPAAMAAAARARAAAAKQPPAPKGVEQGVQADMSVATGMMSASSLIDELKNKSQPNGRQSSPGRLQNLKPAAAQVPHMQTSAIAVPMGQSSPTTSQVEEAIKAAQVALLQRRWQISQLRKAMQQHGITPAGPISNSSSPAVTAGGCRITAGSRTSAASIRQSQPDGISSGRVSTSASSPAAAQGAAAGSPGLSLRHNAEHEGASVGASGSYASQAAAVAALIKLRHSTGGVPFEELGNSTAVGASELQHDGPEEQPASQAAQPASGAADVSTSRASATARLSEGAARRHSTSSTSPFAAEPYHNIGTGGMSGVPLSPLAWSAPRRVSSSGMTGQELMRYYRESSAAETAEAAAIAAEEGAPEGTTVPGAMNLDAMLRAYNALSRRKNSVDKSAALAALMANIVAVAGVQALPQISSEDAVTATEPSSASAQEDSLAQDSSADVPSQEAAEATAGIAASVDAEASPERLPSPSIGVPADALAAAAAEGSGLVIVRKADTAKPGVGSIRLKDTATGQAVLSGIDGTSLTVQQAVHWLKVGLTRIPGTSGGGDPHVQQQLGSHGAAGAGSSKPGTPRDKGGSPSKGKVQSRPCSPFNCFTGGQEDIYDQDEPELGTVQQTSAGGAAQQLQDGVQFEMDDFNQLVMVVPQHLSPLGPAAAAAAGVCKYTVTGVSLLCDSSRGVSQGGRFSSADSTASHSLELVTCVGRHKIELASERDWAGLLAGLNAMLLLREAQGSSKLAKNKLEDVPISEIAWSSAVEGVEL